MIEPIYRYSDYKKYLKSLIESYPNQGRGIRKQMAEALRCQIAYVSHVLSGNYHFSPEQTEAAARFFGLDREDSEFLMILVSHNRAGTQELKRFYESMIAERAEKYALLKSRAKIKETLDREDQATYYSQWYFAAIHMALTIPILQTKDAIATKLGVSSKKTQEVLEFLVTRGLARREGARYVTTQQALHLEANSPLIARHHSNWRMAAVRSLEDPRASDVHYSGVVTCSEKELPKVKERISRCLEDCMELVKPSKEERIAVICLDWWEL